MPPRPLPVVPRLARRPRVAPAKLLLACPRISPEWELGALRALIKPQLKDAIRHRAAGQALARDARQRVDGAIDLVAGRIGYRAAVHWPEAGDFLFVAEILPGELDEAKALALVLSCRLPGAWLVLGRLFVRDGGFFRRERGFRLNLVPAANVHLSRPIRSALNGALSCEASTSRPKRSTRSSAAR